MSPLPAAVSITLRVLAAAAILTVGRIRRNIRHLALHP